MPPPWATSRLHSSPHREAAEAPSTLVPGVLVRSRQILSVALRRWVGESAGGFKRHGRAIATVLYTLWAIGNQSVSAVCPGILKGAPTTSLARGCADRPPEAACAGRSMNGHSAGLEGTLLSGPARARLRAARRYCSLYAMGDWQSKCKCGLPRSAPTTRRLRHRPPLCSTTWCMLLRLCHLCLELIPDGLFGARSTDVVGSAVDEPAQHRGGQPSIREAHCAGVATLAHVVEEWNGEEVVAPRAACAQRAVVMVHEALGDDGVERVRVQHETGRIFQYSDVRDMLGRGTRALVQIGDGSACDQRSSSATGYTVNRFFSPAATPIESPSISARPGCAVSSSLADATRYVPSGATGNHVGN